MKPQGRVVVESDPERHARFLDRVAHADLVRMREDAEAKQRVGQHSSLTTNRGKVKKGQRFSGSMPQMVRPPLDPIPFAQRPKKLSGFAR